MMEARIIDKPQQLDNVLDLLKSNKLPFQDVKLENNQIVAYHDADGKMIGSGGLEFYGSYALLRSVAVNEAERGRSIGKAIVKDLLDRAKLRSVTEIYLLTETAHDFFGKLGFSDVPRESVPPEVQSASEFKSVCPVSASCMIYRL